MHVIEILFCQMVEGDKVFPILSHPCYRLVLQELGHRIASMLRFLVFFMPPMLRGGLCLKPVRNPWMNGICWQTIKKIRNVHKHNFTAKQNFLLHNIFISVQDITGTLCICLPPSPPFQCLFFKPFPFSQAKLPPMNWHLYWRMVGFYLFHFKIITLCSICCLCNAKLHPLHTQLHIVECYL